MKAKIHGIEVEGTLEEVLKFKDEMDKREEVKNLKPVHITYVVNHKPLSSDASWVANELRNRNPYFTQM